MNQMSSHITPADWRLLCNRIRDGKCVPFLGAGASMGYEGAHGLPTAAELAAMLAEEAMYPGVDRNDFLRVCQYYELTFDQYELRRQIGKRLKQAEAGPGSIHKALAALPVSCVLTTNYDSLMEQAFQEAGKQPVPAIHDLHGDKVDLEEPTESRPLVYKFHGTIERPTTMICTEDDVIEFLSKLITGVPPLPPFIKQAFLDSSILFIGYGLKDWNIRVMLRALRGPNRDSKSKSFAIQRRPVGDESMAADWEASVLYWDRREHVRCFDMDAVEFVTTLAEKYGSAAGETR